MRRAFKMQDLECANCASKMEDAINKLEGVNKATVNFMTQKMMIDAEPDRMDEILSQAQRICTKYEPDCVILR